jgi:hypothetical protein
MSDNPTQPVQPEPADHQHHKGDKVFAGGHPDEPDVPTEEHPVVDPGPDDDEDSAS